MPPPPWVTRRSKLRPVCGDQGGVPRVAPIETSVGVDGPHGIVAVRVLQRPLVHAYFAGRSLTTERMKTLRGIRA